jgi:putative DNA primase/helicase
MATGNKSRKIVIDTDAKNNGVANWKQLVEENSGIPTTLMVKTPHDGDHLYFIMPDIDIKKSEGKLASGIDVRANNSYIVIPPSSNYSMIGSLDNFADLPDWLLDKLLEIEKNRHQPSEKLSSMKVIKEGTRNDTLFREASALRDRGYEENEIYAAVNEIAQNRIEGEFDQKEILSIVQSAMRYEPTKSIVTPIEHPYTLTDVGNAERLVAQHGENIRYCEQMKTWFIWNGKYWEKDNNNKIRGYAHTTAKSIYQEAAQCRDSELAKKLGDWAKISLSSQRLDGMLKEAKSYAAISVDEFDIFPELLNVKNGVINLRTRQLIPHNKEYLFTQYIDIKFDKEAVCPKWDGFLNMIFAGNPELINFVQKLAGLSVSGITDEQVLIFLYGLGANGKSTFVNTLHKIMDSYGIAINIEAFLRKSDIGGTTPYLVNLLNKRFVTATEIPEGRRLNESLIKQLSGQDDISVNPKYEKAYSFSPTHKLWIVGNHKPQVRDDSYGFWRRLKVIPFEIKIPEEEQRPMSIIIQDFLEEAPGILNWLVEGFQKWVIEGLNDPIQVKDATKEYQSEQDLLQQFLDEECDLNSDIRIPKKDLLEKFNNWLLSSGEEKYTTSKLTRQLIGKDIGIKVGGDGKKYYLGLGLKEKEILFSDSDSSIIQQYHNNETISVSSDIRDMVDNQIGVLFDDTTVLK